nr:AMP-binding protein [Campylobacter jejuni]
MTTHIYDFLEKSLIKFSEKTAFVEPFVKERKEITYKDFDLFSKKLASEILKTLGNDNPTQAPVLIILPKGIDCLISFFGVALSGNFYTLLDEKSPKERVEKVIEVLKPKLFITSKDLNFNLDLPTLYTQDFESFNIDESLIKHAKEKHIDTNLLYVFFTSGSTGIPKGVSIAHKSVIDYTFWVCETFKFDENEILANQAPFYFDNSILDIFSSVKSGATLHLLPNHLFAFPNKILECLEKEKVSTIFWVPSVLIYFANTEALNNFSLNALKKMLFCGEIMPNKQLNIWRKHLPNALFANLYGPTEITDVCSFYIINRTFKDEELLPIGKACKNTELLVFDENMNFISPKQIGVKGELSLWSLQVSVSSVITGMLLLLIYVINLAMVCENGIYIVSKFNLFYMYFIKREDLEIVKIEKMKFLNQVEVCFVIKTKNKILLKCFESIYKKEDLEKLKNWYENKL